MAERNRINRLPKMGDKYVYKGVANNERVKVVGFLMKILWCHDHPSRLLCLMFYLNAKKTLHSRTKIRIDRNGRNGIFESLQAYIIHRSILQPFLVRQIPLKSLKEKARQRYRALLNPNISHNINLRPKIYRDHRLT